MRVSSDNPGVDSKMSFEFLNVVSRSSTSATGEPFFALLAPSTSSNIAMRAGVERKETSEPEFVIFSEPP